MTSESARETSKWSDADLAYALRYQQSRGEHTWGPGLCGHYARGSGFCADCLQAEIDRRAAAGGRPSRVDPLVTAQLDADRAMLAEMDATHDALIADIDATPTSRGRDD